MSDFLKELIFPVLDGEAIVDLVCDFSYLYHVFNLLKIFICQSIAVIEENFPHPLAFLYADSDPAGTFKTEFLDRLK